MIAPGLYLAGLAGLALWALHRGCQRERAIRQAYRVSRAWLDGRRGL